MKFSQITQKAAGCRHPKPNIPVQKYFCKVPILPYRRMNKIKCFDYLSHSEYVTIKANRINVLAYTGYTY